VVPLGNGGRGFNNQVTLVVADQTVSRIHDRRCLLDASECVNQGGGDPVLGNGEILKGALGLRPPERLLRHMHGAHAVVFGARRVRHGFEGGLNTRAMISSIPLTLTTT